MIRLCIKHLPSTVTLNMCNNHSILGFALFSGISQSGFKLALCFDLPRIKASLICAIYSSWIQKSFGFVVAWQ